MQTISKLWEYTWLRFKEKFPEITITILAYSVTLCFFSLVPDDYSSFGFNLASKQFSNYHYFDCYFLGMLGLTEIYKVLYYLAPSYNWAGISFVAFGLFALYLTLRTINTIVRKSTNHVIVTRIIQVLFVVFFIENIVTLSHTRFSLVFCGVGLIGLVIIQDITRLQKLWYFLLFILGALIRPEGGICMILLVPIGFLIGRYKLKHLLERLLLPVSFSVLLILGIAIDRSYADSFVKKVEPEVEYKMTAREVVDISTMKTAVDSIKYQAAIRGMWFDYKILTPEYLRSLQITNFTFNTGQITNRESSLARTHAWRSKIDFEIQHALNVFIHVLTFYRDYSFVPYTLFAAVLFLILGPSGWRQAIKIILFAVYTFLLIYAVDYHGFLLSARHFLGIQQVSFLLVVCYCFDTARVENYNKVILFICTLLTLTGVYFNLVFCKQNNDDALQVLNKHQLYMKGIERNFKDQIVVVTNDNYVLFDRTFSLRNHNYNKNKYIMFDVFTYSLTPNYLNYLNTECNCDASDPVAFYQWLSDKKALYITKPSTKKKSSRSILAAQYMSIVHNQKLVFAPINMTFKFEKGRGVENPDFLITRVIVE